MEWIHLIILSFKTGQGLMHKFWYKYVWIWKCRDKNKEMDRYMVCCNRRDRKGGGRKGDNRARDIKKFW